MDARRFDTLIRTLTASPSRRTVLSLVGGGTLTSLLGLAEAEAKKKRKKKKCKGNKKKCGKKCIPKTACCGGCGACESCQNGSCVNGCQTGQTCVGGQCTCTTGSCPNGCCDGDTCIAEGECCPTATGVCQSGSCEPPVATLADCQGRCDCTLGEMACGPNGRASVELCGQTVFCPNCQDCESLACGSGHHSCHTGPAGAGSYCASHAIGQNCGVDPCPTGYTCCEGERCVQFCDGS